MPKNLKSAPVWMAVALAVVTVAVYWPVTGFQFIDLDDTEFITANPHVQAGLTAKGFKWAWCSIVTGDWHPLTMWSLMLDCQLFGVKPWWPHLVNMLLHAANTVLLFGLFNRMTGAAWRSAVVAALFALHPLHVESVAWVSERKDVLSTLFWFLTMWAYVRYAEKWRVASSQWPVFYGLSLVFYALGLMSKPMLVTLPFTLLLLDYWPLERIKAWAGVWRLAWEKMPFFAMSAALCVVTIEAQKQSGGMLGLDALPLGARLGNALASYVRYIGMMFWPRHLAGLYLIKSGQWPWWEATLAVLSLLAVSALVLAQWRRRPYLAMGWFWYIGTLVPVIGLAQAGMQAMADRFTYVPLIGLFVMVVWGGWELAGGLSLERLAPAATAAALAACAALTVHQEYYWKDSETFNKRMIDVTENNYVAHNNLGIVYFNANRTQEAFAQFKASVEENPDYAEAHNNLGDLLLRQECYDEAVGHFRSAVRLRPKFAYYYNLANALEKAGIARHDSNALAEAVPCYQQALELDPGSAAAHHNLGMAWQAQGRIPEALAELEQSARLDPNLVDTWTQLGLLCAGQQRMPEAERAFREIIRLQPGNGEAFRYLGNVLAAQNKLAEAAPAYLTALKLNPADWGTEFNLACTLSLQGRREEAAEHYRQALRINPNLAEAQKALSAMERAPGAPNGGAR